MASGDHQQMTLLRRLRHRRRARRHPGHRRVGRPLPRRVHRAGAARLPRGHRVDRRAAVVHGGGRDDGLLVERLQLPPGRGAAAARAEGDRLDASRPTIATPTTSTTAAGSSIPMEMVHWSTCMLGWQARPPDARIVGERWREMWLERLELEPWIAHWLAHQRRDAYWQQGSVREDYGAHRAVRCCASRAGPTGTRDAALRLMEGARRAAARADRPVGSPRSGARRAGAGGRDPRRARALVGALARRASTTGIDGRADGRRLPAGLRALRPPTWPSDPGRYVGRGGVAVAADRTAHARARRRHARRRRRRRRDPRDRQRPDRRARGRRVVRRRRGRPTCRSTSASEDARSLVFNSEPLAEPLEILGFPEARLVVAADRPLCARLGPALRGAPDGASLLVTRGQLNLCHRRSHAEPEPLVPGRGGRGDGRMDSIATGSRRQPDPARALALLLAARLAVARAGHARRCATAAGRAGAARAPAAGRGRPAAAARPAGGAGAPREELLHGGSGGFRRIDARPRERRDGADLRLGLRRVSTRCPNGIEYEDTSVATYWIVEGDPLSARVRVENTSRARPRGDWQVEIRAAGTMTCTAAEFLVTSELEVREEARPVFARTWTHGFPRDYG